MTDEMAYQIALGVDRGMTTFGLIFFGLLLFTFGSLAIAHIVAYWKWNK